MNFGIITYPNAKGQIVIPKKFRDKLAITPKTPVHINTTDHYLTIQPIINTQTIITDPSGYLEILKKTQGAWANENWAEYDRTEKKRGLLESKAIKKLKRSW